MRYASDQKSRAAPLYAPVTFIFTEFNQSIYRRFTPFPIPGDLFKTLKKAVQQRRLKRPDIEQERPYRSNLEQLPSEQARQVARVLNVCNHALQYFGGFDRLTRLENSATFPNGASNIVQL
jgi:hypothetical protein